MISHPTPNPIWFYTIRSIHCERWEINFRLNQRKSLCIRWLSSRALPSCCVSFFKFRIYSCHFTSHFHGIPVNTIRRIPPSCTETRSRYATINIPFHIRTDNTPPHPFSTLKIDLIKLSFILVVLAFQSLRACFWLYRLFTKKKKNTQLSPFFNYNSL